MLNHKRTLIAALVSVSLMGCGESTTQTETKPQLTAQDAKQFLTQAQNDIAKMQVPAAHAEWSYATN
ncbi:MAG: peptidase M2 family protein, partial [Pseudomonadota bacterium]|nr:peptidase M2 family protein [Pseudomonadota bacterium]